MYAKKHQFKPDYAIPPGETIAEIMESISLTSDELAASLGLNQEEFSSLLRGNMPLSSTLAKKLEVATSMPADFWNELELQYRAYLQSEWLSNIPVKELLKRRLIPTFNNSNSSVKLKTVLDFFGVEDVNEWNSVWMQPSVAARRSKCFDTAPYLAATWIRIGELEAQQNPPSQPTDVTLFKERLPSIRALTIKPPNEFIPALKSICRECGVIILFIPELPRLPWYGATRWLNQTAVIMLNIRGKSEDKFWFSLFHEISHVILHDKDQLLINDGNNEDKREKEANDFAANILFGEKRHLIPTLDSQKKLLSFANSIGIAPGIVAGQYQFMTGKYKFYHRLIRKFKWVE